MWWGGFFVLFLEMKSSACGIQWMDCFEYPALLLLLVALNRLSPNNNAVDCLALDARASSSLKSRSLVP